MNWRQTAAATVLLAATFVAYRLSVDGHQPVAVPEKFAAEPRNTSGEQLSANVAFPSSERGLVAIKYPELASSDELVQRRHAQTVPMVSASIAVGLSAPGDSLPDPSNQALAPDASGPGLGTIIVSGTTLGSADVGLPPEDTSQGFAGYLPEIFDSGGVGPVTEDSWQEEAEY